MKKISPSVLDVEKNKLTNYIDQLVDWGVCNVHYDVMDGIFVNNTALTFQEIKQVKENCKKHTMDIHLMVKDVFKYYEMYKNIGDILTFHYEAFENSDLEKMIKQCQKDNVKLGLAIKPNTQVEEIKQYLKHCSLVLIMSVEPGFGGQKFIENSFNKIKELADIRKALNLNFIIEVDGGVKDQNIAKCFECGVDLAVVGSYLVKNFSKETINQLLK
ncbi:ribulose-phosphate 3-epimerase [Mycoplasma hominis]|uniref:ribulose-phosphate 3-epimerase n=1 Tax=Metamycoplasma hominis TaxID=2098 RepID=UPI001F1C75BF|nr:ribulose-phosphate 3-epimerase [Metamycoplasma hominis]MCF1354996.1 ribulose-phosphate 3-epimerase [Metamycoplasma hominis]